MKLIIDVDKKLVCEGFERTFTEEERDILIRAIGNGVEYVEPKKGEWEYQYSFCDEKLYKCTHCGRLLSIHNFQDISEFHFCQECGANMKEAEE